MNIKEKSQLIPIVTTKSQIIILCPPHFFNGRIHKIGKSVDAFVAGVGTGGTLSGIGRALKKENPNTKVYALEPSESPLLKDGKTSKHGIQGIAAGLIPKNLDKDVYDGIVEVSTDEAMKTACEVAKNEGFLPGISAGANIHGAIELAKKLGKGHAVVTVSPDGSDRYLSTALFILLKSLSRDELI